MMRYGELKKSLYQITHKMLTQQLRELEEDGFVNRVVFPVIPPKVEYSLTDNGKEVIPIVDVIRNFGLKLMKEENVNEIE